MGKKVDLTKSIDSMIDDLFADKVQKSEMPENLNVAGQAKTTADAAVSAAPKGQKDEARGAGRPEQISEVPQVDTDGKRAGKYDDDITKKGPDSGDEPDEAKKQADAKRSDQTMGRQEKDGEGLKAAMGKSLSDSEYAEYQALKKAKAAKEQEEVLRKAEAKQTDLIKSAVREATSVIQKENEELRKSLKETNELVKAMAERPQRRKSIDGIQALEKSQGDAPAGSGGPEHFSKAEMLDAAEELVAKSTANKDMSFQLDHLIELENTGFIFDKRARGMLENALKSRK
jgi:hypothetical protein